MNTTIKNSIPLLLGAALLGACSAASTDDGAGTASTAPAPATRASTAFAPPPDAARTKVASDALFRVRDVVASGRVSAIGFASPSELDDATLGEAIPVYFVSGADVLARTPGADPREVLGQPMEMIYPVLVNGVAKSEVVMARDATGSWAVFGVGGAETIQSIDRTTQALASGGHAAPVALLEMHDVGVSLLAHEEAGAVKMTAFAEKTGASLPLGEHVDAETAFARVAEIARVRTSLAR